MGREWGGDAYVPWWGMRIGDCNDASATFYWVGVCALLPAQESWPRCDRCSACRPILVCGQRGGTRGHTSSRVPKLRGPCLQRAAHAHKARGHFGAIASLAMERALEMAPIEVESMDGTWYRAVITAYNPVTCEHSILYHDGEKQEYLLWHYSVRSAQAGAAKRAAVAEDTARKAREMARNVAAAAEAAEAAAVEAKEQLEVENAIARLVLGQTEDGDRMMVDDLPSSLAATPSPSVHGTVRFHRSLSGSILLRRL